MGSLKDLNTESWDDRLGARAHTYQLRGRFKFAVERLARHQPKRWLDVGTGNGFLPQIARPYLKDVHITGVDFAENALIAAGALDERVAADFDGQPLPFAEAAFDCITCLEVLEHLVFPQRTLHEFCRVLTPGGKLLITVPNLQFIEYPFQLLRGKVPGPAADARHMSVFTHRFLGKMLEKAGFRVTLHSGCDASPEWFAKISPRYLAKTIAIEGKRQS